MNSMHEPRTTLDTTSIRSEFPILAFPSASGVPLVYLDSAATTQKPSMVLDVMDHYYKHFNANAHRGSYKISNVTTAMYEDARATVAALLNAPFPESIIFTRGTTEGINLVASSWGRAFLNEGDEVLLTEMEHHSNIIPWQLICNERKAKLKVVPVSEDGQISSDEVCSMMGPRTRLFAFAHASNTLGTINDVSTLCAIARERGVVTLVDGAQAVAHADVDVQEIGCDFYAFSGHKIYGPTGIGALYGRPDILQIMAPYQGGGAMIQRVSFEGSSYALPPQRFEAGTPNIVGAIGLDAAIRWFRQYDSAEIFSYEEQLTEYALHALMNIEGTRVYGIAPARGPVISFNIDGVHPFDLGLLLDQSGIAVRVGHHCTQPLMDKYKVSAMTRASFAIHTTLDEVNYFIESIRKALIILR